MIRKAATSVCAVLTLMCTVPSHAVGNRVDVQVIDRSSGDTLTPILYRGEWWIAGRPGARYAVVLANRLGQRTLNVLSVDGVNAVSGETAAWNQRGYVLDPYTSMQVTGWRTSMDQVAAFEFTTLANSYATRTGRPANLGVIGIAIFNERPQAITQGQIGRESRADAPLLRSHAEPSARAEADASTLESTGTNPAANTAATPEAAPHANDTRKSEAARMGSLVPHQRERIGTGYGAIENSSIVNVRFDRMQSAPNEIVTIHYDRRENLVAMGIIALPPLPPVAANPAVNPFPHSGGFVPEPPPRRW